MAEVIQSASRGRKKEQLRLTAAELAPKVKAGSGETSVTVELLPPSGKFKGESVTFSIPKGAVVVPFELTNPKADGNAREQIASGVAKDAGLKDKVSIRRQAIRMDDGTETSVWYLAGK